MTKTKIIFVFTSLCVIGSSIYFYLSHKNKVDNFPSNTGTFDSISASSSPTVTSSPTPQASTISPIIRAKVRSNFVSSCQSKGKASLNYCNCAADYLATNYSDSDLEKMYVDYHTSNKLPSDVMSAVDQECNNK